MTYAGFWKRVAATLIDFIIFIVVGSLLGLLLGIIGLNLAIVEALLNILSFIGGWLYYALMESSSKQATIGKIVLGIKVTDLNGHQISFARATGRYFGMILSGLILGIGYLMVAFTEKKQGLHDIMAKCLVVNNEQNSPKGPVAN